jgi:cell wall assembly regulator SMI1
MASTVRDAWTSINEWLERNAPETASTLQAAEPASASRVAAHLGQPLHPELVDYLETVPGSLFKPLLGLHSTLLASRMIEDSMMRHEISEEIWSDAPPGDVAGQPEHAWSGQFLALTSDSMGGALFIDLREGDMRGCIRAWDKVDGSVQHRASVWSGPAALLESAMSALTGVTPFDRFFVPAAVDGRLEWRFQD